MSRRTVLGGAAAVVSLPWLEAMLPFGGRARADAEGACKRAVFYYTPNGFHMPAWTPAEDGADYTMSTILAPLERHRDDILVLSNLANTSGNVPGVPGDHAQGTAAFLTCRTARKTEGADLRAGISVDQVMAEAFGDATSLRSLQLGLQGGGSTGGCDSGYSCAYTRNITWASESTPLPKMTNPRLVFDRMFSGWDTGATTKALVRRREYRLSVLDHVAEESVALAATLGAADRAKLDEYLTGVRELERRIGDTTEAPVCDPGDLPPVNYDYPEHVLLMSDLLVLALQCDVTRIVSFMLGNAASNRNYGFIGVSGAHHELSHHQNDPATQDLLTVIGTWEIEQLAYLLDRMKLVEEPTGTLLDNTLLMFSSEIADGNAHQHFNLPVLLAGNGGGAITTGRHVRLPEGEEMANLYIALLDFMGVEVDTFGEDGTHPLEGLI
jgi:hypothetical protein